MIIKKRVVSPYSSFCHLVDSTLSLQIGHFFSTFNHSSKHMLWNSCLQAGSILKNSLLQKSLMQIVQLSVFVLPLNHIFDYIASMSFLLSPRLTCPAFSCISSSYSYVIPSTFGLFGSDSCSSQLAAKAMRISLSSSYSAWFSPACIIASIMNLYSARLRLRCISSICMAI